MRPPDQTPGDVSANQSEGPPPLRVETLGYSSEAPSVVSSAVRLVCWFAIVLGGCDSVNIAGMFIGPASFALGEMTLFWGARSLLAIAMMTGGVLMLTHIRRRAGRQILMLWAWGSLILAAYLLLRAAGATMSRVPYNRPLWISGMTLVGPIYNSLTVSIMPALTLMLLREQDARLPMELDEGQSE